MNELVQCRSTWCGAYKICSHAKEHAERQNCYQDDHGQRRQCPLCQPVEKKDGL